MGIVHQRCKSSVLVGLILMVLTLSPFGVNEGLGAKERQLIIADILLPTSFDPAVATDVVSRAFTYATYEGLLRYKPGTTELEPSLSESWEISSNHLEYTFNLRKDVKFHDQSSFNGEAVKFSIERIQKINRAPAIYIKDIKEVEVIGEHKVKIILKEANPTFLQRLPMIYMVSPKYVKANEEKGDWGQKYLNENMKGGTGPYYMETLQPGEYAILAKNPGYWRGWKNTNNNIDKIVWKPIKESATRRLLLDKGDIHISNRVEVDDLRALQRNPNIQIVEAPNFACQYLRMNNKRKPFDDIRVRKAVAYAFDYKAAIEKIMGNHASEMYGPMPKGLFGHNDTLNPFKQDIERAKKILEEGGFKAGDIKFEYVYLKEVPSSRPIGEILQVKLKELGIEMAMRETTWVTLLGMVKDPGTTPQLFDGAHGDAPIDDSIDFLMKQFHSKSAAGVFWNQNWYVNPKVDELLEQASKTMDPRRRITQIREVQKIIYEDVPQIFLFQKHTMKPMHKNIKGYKLDPLSWGQFNFYDMYFAD